MDERDMGEGKTRQQVVAEQAEALAEALAANENLDAQFAVVTFSDSLGSTQYYNDAAIRLSWTDNTSAVYSAANQKSTGGTNYEAGMMTGRAALIESRPDALKYVIFSPMESQPIIMMRTAIREVTVLFFMTYI